MSHRAVAIANAFLSFPNALETVTQMQLQKLCYFAHGWSLAISGEPLIADPVEAWAYGPVYRDLYDHTKYFGKEPVSRLITPDDDSAVRFFSRPNGRRPPYEAKLGGLEEAIIDQVWKRYSHLSAIRLSELTHQTGTPWYQTYTGKGRNAQIDQSLIRSHYEQLAERSRKAAN